jgi:thioesterase domain-containing protein
MELKIPKRILFVDKIPKSATGKPKQIGLAEKFAALLSEQAIREFVPPQTRLEKTLAAIWSRVLGVESIGIHDNFFDLGGHSLLSLKVISRVQKETGQRIYPREMMLKTLGQIAAACEARASAVQHAVEEREGKGGAFSFLVELQRGKSGKPIFFFPGGEGGDSEFFYLMRLARNMRPDYQFYGFRARGVDGVSEPHASVEEIVRDYIVEIEKLQPEGPYFLIGDCIGGTVAFEAARQLTAKGQKIAVLILLDSHRPTKLKYYAHRCLRLRDRFLAAVSRRWQELLHQHGRNESLHFLGKTLARTAPASDPQPQGQSTASPLEPMGQLQNPINPQNHIRRVGQLYSLNLRAYHAKPYKGEIKLIVNEKSFQLNPTLGWLKLATGVDSYVVPGDHSALGGSLIVARQLTKWLDEAQEEDGNSWSLEQTYEPQESRETPLFLTQRLEAAKRDLAGFIPKGNSFILVDQCEWGSSILADRSAIPFLEHDGQYYGLPSDDETAIREFERLRRTGAKFIVFGWPAFWWLDYYGRFGRYLYSKFRCVLKNDRLVVFDLSL